MTSPIVLDLLIVGILVLFTLLGAHRGFVLTLCSLVAVLVALVGANFLADTLTPVVSTAIEPAIERTIQTTVERQAEALQGEGVDQLLVGLKDKGGLYALVGDTMEEALADTIETNVVPALSQLVSQAAALVARELAHGVIFVLAFLLVLIGWIILSHALDLVAKLPIISSLNGLLGGVIGLVKGLILAWLCVWGLYTLTGIVPAETVEQTHLFLFLSRHGPLELLLAGQLLLKE